MSLIPTYSEVVVIGGGPAGSLTATYLAQKGVPVVLLEKTTHPRYAVGESLIPDIWKYCDLAGVTDDIINEGFLPKAGGTVNWKGQIRTHRFADFGFDRPALHVERDRFDYLLLQNSIRKGAQVFENTAVSSVNFADETRPIVSYRQEEDGAGGTTAVGTIACRFVVDATGQSSLLSKQLNLWEMDDAFRHMSVWGYFEDSRYVAYGGRVHPRQDLRSVNTTTYITSLDETGETGWSWHIPLRETTSVGLVLPQHVMKSLRANGESWEDYFVRKCMETPVVGRLLENARFTPGSLRIIRDYSYTAKELTGPGYFLVGDASGFIDPIFSVGVVLGMYSAFAAAWAIEMCLKTPERTSSQQGLFSKMLRGRIELARSLALPGYRTSGQVSDMARMIIGFERRDSHELMQVVSDLTSRSENYREMMGTNGSTSRAGLQKVYAIDEIVFEDS